MIVRLPIVNCQLPIVASLSQFDFADAALAEDSLQDVLLHDDSYNTSYSGLNFPGRLLRSQNISY